MLGEVQGLARQHTAEAIETLAAIMQDMKAPDSARALASNSILDRAYGKPAQTLNTSVTGRSANELSDEELVAIIQGGKSGLALNWPRPAASRMHWGGCRGPCLSRRLVQCAGLLPP